jgi:predicted ATP-dependent serine protease
VRLRSPSRAGDREERGTPLFAPLSQILAAAPPEPPWLWQGYVARGSITLLAGLPKVGKSTLVVGLLRALATGESFLGKATKDAGVLLVSEERTDALAEKARRFALGANVHAPRPGELARGKWPELIEGAVAYSKDKGLDLLVIDGFASLAGLVDEEENQAGPVLERLRPLQEAAAGDLAVLLVAHQRKGGGRYGEGVRGSTALTGEVDIVLELERRGDARTRVLKAVSRYSATPEQLRFALEDEGYTLANARGGVADDRDRVLGALKEQGGLTAAMLADRLAIPEGTIRRHLRRLRPTDVRREGGGKRGSAYLWFPATAP